MARESAVKATAFDVRQLDSWHDGEGWTVNNSFVVKTTKLWGKDLGKCCKQYVKRHNFIVSGRHLTVDESAFPMVTIELRKTGEPVFTFVPLEE